MGQCCPSILQCFFESRRLVLLPLQRRVELSALPHPAPADARRSRFSVARDPADGRDGLQLAVSLVCGLSADDEVCDPTVFHEKSRSFAKETHLQLKCVARAEVCPFQLKPRGDHIRRSRFVLNAKNRTVQQAHIPLRTPRLLHSTNVSIRLLTGASFGVVE